MAHPLENRKAALRVREVPPAVQKALSRGEIETKNLAEMLALDFEKLFRTVLGELSLPVNQAAVMKDFRVRAGGKIMTQLKGGAQILFELDSEYPHAKVFRHLSEHRSDSVRSWAAFVASKRPLSSLSKRFTEIAPFAADSNMGVRECAWMALRPHVVEDFKGAKPHLLRWAKHKQTGIRRCAVEATRPRGVWCEHFELLKAQPELAREILDSVHTDSARYVQNSAANWLNDASKSNPKWVKQVCSSWSRSSKTPETAYIVRRALRTLNKL